MHPANEFRLPDLGEGLTDAELVRWSVAVGDIVELDQVIAEVETAKALVELPSPFAGTVLALLAEPGTIVEVGAPLIRIGEPGAGDSPAERRRPPRNQRTIRPRWWGTARPPRPRAGGERPCPPPGPRTSNARGPTRSPPRAGWPTSSAST
ncbi:biotin-requiring enzyme family protein [Rhodococcus sp. MTM3W5.2]|nr:biotin-requiring enzyme family protein [Rhodococcus sp. MTM3W5.2]